MKKVFKVTNREYPDISMYKNLYFWLGDWIPSKCLFTSGYASTCRDLIVGQYRDYYETFGNSAIPSYKNTFEKNPFRSTTFVLTVNGMEAKHFRERIKHILRFLHAFERRLRWKRTEIIDIDELRYHTKYKEVARPLKALEHIVLVRGSKCWNNNPIIFYVYLAVFKLLFDAKHHKAFAEAKSFEDLFDKAEELLGPNLAQYLSASEWPSVVLQRRKIFKGFDLHALYKPANKSVDTYGMGIRSFMKEYNALRYFRTKDKRTLLKASQEFVGGKK